ncbi:MAG: hypothetical protein ACOX6D_10070 [Thermoguttaceae bacterium]|jgi:hypothetical protein
MSTFPPYFLFSLRFEAKKVPTGKVKLTPEYLGEKYEFPALWEFTPQAATSDRKLSSADSESNRGAGKKVGQPEFHFRMGWREDGLFLTVLLAGKKFPVQVNPRKLEASDSFSFMLDTRDVRIIHRATKFCHRFLLTPADPRHSNQATRPSVVWLPIHRAKAHPNPVDTSRFEIACDTQPGGWSLSLFMPGDTLTGYDPKEYSRIGVGFILFDNEFGSISQQLPDDFPVMEDPSLWAAVDLIE